MTDDKKPTVLGRQRAPQGALVRPCPKCHAPVGHQCRVLRGVVYAGDRKAVVHRERRRG